MEYSYSDFINEISKEELFDGLGYGMFPDKIPPMFTSIPLLTYCKTNDSWKAKNESHSAITYENMRNISIPRVLSIPHPASYVNLCEFLRDNWDKIQNHFAQNTSQDYKVSRIHLRKIANKKALFEMNYKNGSKDGFPVTDLLIGSKFLVKADISTCYASIYTHTIPWALVGIEESKSESKSKVDNKAEWYNLLDFYTRNLKDSETNGILIGPHTSVLIAEIILVVIDDKLKKYKYVRNIDDYSCYVSSLQEAEEFLRDLNSILRSYQLNLNYKKTEVIMLPISSDDSWVTKMNNIQLPDQLAIPVLRTYLDTAIGLSNKTGNISVINFAIKVLSKKKLYSNARLYYIKVIHHLLLIYPYLLSIIEKYVFMPFATESDQIQKIANTICSDGQAQKRYEAISYALYFSIKYEFRLDNDDFINDVRNYPDCIFMVMSFCYDKIHHPEHIEDYKTIAKTLQQDQARRDQFWLFIYEVLDREEITSSEKVFRSLKMGEVSFLRSFFTVPAGKTRFHKMRLYLVTNLKKYFPNKSTDIQVEYCGKTYTVNYLIVKDRYRYAIIDLSPIEKFYLNSEKMIRFTALGDFNYEIL